MEHRTHAPQTSEHIPDTEELQAHYDMELVNAAETSTDETEQNHDTREISPTASRVRAAAERIGSILERRALTKAHSDAIKEYRQRDIEGYSNLIDNLARSDEPYADDFARLQRKEDRIASREELIDAGKERLRSVGSMAIEKSKEAGTIAYGLGIIGSEKAKGAAKEAGLTALGLGVMGYEAASKRVDTAKFRHELNATERTSRRSDKKELRAHDKAAKKELKQTHKQIKRDAKQLARENKAFDRDLARTARIEKWEARANKIDVFFEEKKEAIAVRVEKGATRTVETYLSTKESLERKKQAAAEKKRRMGAFALKARNAGAAAWAAGREEIKK